jgi:hypothetical protein
MPPDHAPANPTRHDYDRNILDACYRVLATIVKAVDGQRVPRLVLIGGLAPTLLLDAAHLDELFTNDAHPGTSDVDFCVQVDLTNDANLYASLLRTLQELGFAPMKRNDGFGESLWQWVRDIDHAKIAVEFLSPADGVESQSGTPSVGRIGQATSPRPGDEIGAFRLPAGELAFQDACLRRLTVDLLGPPGERSRGIAEVDVWVANLLPLLVLKSFALKRRTKHKDAFDIVWLLTRWPGGPAQAARDARTSPVAGSPHVVDAIAILDRSFRDSAQHGCQQYAIFELGGVGAEQEPAEALRLARDAEGAVQRFLTTWRAISL